MRWTLAKEISQFKILPMSSWQGQYSPVLRTGANIALLRNCLLSEHKLHPSKNKLMPSADALCTSSIVEVIRRTVLEYLYSADYCRLNGKCDFQLFMGFNVSWECLIFCTHRIFRTIILFDLKEMNSMSCLYFPLSKHSLFFPFAAAVLFLVRHHISMTLHDWPHNQSDTLLDEVVCQICCA